MVIMIISKKNNEGKKVLGTNLTIKQKFDVYNKGQETEKTNITHSYLFFFFKLLHSTAQILVKTH